MERGKLTVITGTMFAGKTDEVIRKVRKLRKYGGRKVIVIKPATDTRSPQGFIQTAEGQKMPALEIDRRKPEKILKILKNKTDVDEIAIDEIQFFPASLKVVRVIDAVCTMGYNVLAAGLDLNFRGEPFGATPLLLAMADSVMRLETAHCCRCKKSARLPQRLISGKPAPYTSPTILVGGKESYEVRCYACHELPGKPSPST